MKLVRRSSHFILFLYRTFELAESLGNKRKKDEKSSFVICGWGEEYGRIKSIQIEDGITNVSNNAFIGMTSTDSVSLPNSVTQIGGDAFTNCTQLSSLKMSQNLKVIATSAFQATSKLTSIDLPEGLEEVNIYSNPFNQSGVTSIVIPDSLFNSGKFGTSLLTYSNITTVYCSKEKQKQCDDYIEAVKATGNAKEGLKYETYEKYGNSYLYGGKFYSSLGDIGTTNHIKKRIYTVEEANKVSHPTGNRISITYR